MHFLYEFIDFFYDIRTAAERVFGGTYTERILENTWRLFTNLWYYILLGAFAAAVVAELMSHAKVRTFLSRKGGGPVVAAAALGVLSPMCTFAAIPLAGGLLAAGVPLPPLMAFMIASPLMNPSLFIVTWGVMGPEMAFARTASAFLLGLVGGFTTEYALTRGWGGFSKPLREGFTLDPSGFCLPDGAPGPFRARILAFLRHAGRMTIFISKYFIIALFLAGTVQAVVDPAWIAALLGGGGFKSVLLGGLLGIPFYVCGGGTVALVGVLVAMGMGQGAALAFFITGPATKISTIVSLNAVLNRRTAAVYLAVTLIGGVLLGWGYSAVAPKRLVVDPAAYGRIESKEDSIFFRRGIGDPTGD